MDVRNSLRLQKHNHEMHKFILYYNSLIYTSYKYTIK